MELDYSEVHHSRKIRGTEQVESMEDKRFRKILTNDLHKNENGNWEAPLPFKNDDVTLPNNKGHCLRRLLSLKRKLLGDEKVKADYLAFMQKNLDRGHASRVPTSQLHTQPGKVWYLPHFNVYHPRKPDQIRVVFDCSAVFENESLNKHLLQGPDQLNSLTGVLTRFRKEEVAFTCDIEQMFHNFYVNPEHRDFLRFLWFEKNDLSGPIVEYNMDVHLFGAASSPGVANFCLHQTAESNRATYGNPAADFLRKDFYVDDGLKSLPTVSQALKLIKDCQEMCAQDKLRLHKFASNKKVPRPPVRTRKEPQRKVFEQPAQARPLHRWGRSPQGRRTVEEFSFTLPDQASPHLDQAQSMYDSSRSPVSSREAASPRIRRDSQRHTTSRIPHYQWPLRRLPPYREMHHMPQASRPHWRPENGRPTSWTHLSSTSLHIHRDGCLRPFLHQGRKERAEAMGTDLHLPRIPSNSPGDSERHDCRLFHQRAQTLYRSQRQGTRAEVRSRHQLRRSQERAHHRSQGARQHAHQRIPGIARVWSDQLQLQRATCFSHGWHLGASDSHHTLSTSVTVTRTRQPAGRWGTTYPHDGSRKHREQPPTDRGHPLRPAVPRTTHAKPPAHTKDADRTAATRQVRTTRHLFSEKMASRAVPCQPVLVTMAEGVPRSATEQAEVDPTEEEHARRRCPRRWQRNPKKPMAHGTGYQNLPQQRQPGAQSPDHHVQGRTAEMLRQTCPQASSAVGQRRPLRTFKQRFKRMNISQLLFILDFASWFIRS